MPPADEIGRPARATQKMREVAQDELGLAARCFGRLDGDLDACADDLGHLDNLHGNGGYDRFSGRTGKWQAVMLMNRDGDARDEVSHEYEGSARPTEHWAKIPRLAAMLNGNFRLELASNVRVMTSVAGGMILSHRDYKEHARGGFNRLHVPVQTSPLAVNAEGGVVFHLRPLEVWLIEGREAHSALNAGTVPRHHLTIDFPISVPLETVFRRELLPQDSVMIVEREPMPDKWPDYIRLLGRSMRADTVQSTVTQLNRWAFLYAFSFGAVYDWLVEAARHSPDPTCLPEAEALRRYMLVERAA